MNREQMLAYLAAYVDADGCVIIYFDKNKWSGNHVLRLQVSGTCPRPLEEMQRAFGGHISFRSSSFGGKKGLPVFYWSIHSRQATSVIKDILPFSILKRRELRLALRFRRECYKRLESPVSAATLAQREWYRQSMCELRRRRPRSLQLAHASSKPP